MNKMTKKGISNDPNLMSVILKLEKELYIQRQNQEDNEERRRLINAKALLMRNKLHWKMIG